MTPTRSKRTIPLLRRTVASAVALCGMTLWCSSPAGAVGAADAPGFGRSELQSVPETPTSSPGPADGGAGGRDELVDCGFGQISGQLSAQPSSAELSNQVGFKVLAFRAANTYYLTFGDGRWMQPTSSSTYRYTYARHGEYTAKLYVKKPGCRWIVRPMAIVADPVTTYAPTLVYDPDEKYFADSVDNFLDAAVLVHDLPNYQRNLSIKGCRDNVMAAGPDVSLRRFEDNRPVTSVGTSEPLLSRARLGDASGGQAYEARNYVMGVAPGPAPGSVVPDCSLRGAPPYRAHDVGATKKGSITSDDDGLVLSLAGADDSVLRGDTTFSRTKLYVDYKPDRYVVYWIFYPFNNWTLGPASERHEGDWERVVVRLGAPTSPTMRAVGYFQHYCALDPYSRSEIAKDLDGTHPRVFVAKGGHASYQKDVGFVRDSCVGEHTGQGYGDRTGRGRTQRPWATLPGTDITLGLAIADRQPWFGFKGAWGDPRPATIANYGPQAPGGQSAGVPASWAGSASLYSLGADDASTDVAPDVAEPLLQQPVVRLRSPASRVVTYDLPATDDIGVTEMRVRVSGEDGWRPWVDFHRAGTVILPDRFGEMTVYFQVRDAANQLSLELAGDPVTRVPDTSAPVISAASVSHPDVASQFASFSLAAGDDNGVTELRAFVNGEPRSWVDFASSGTVSLPGYGTFGIGFEVRDAAGNVSERFFAGAVERKAEVSLSLVSVFDSGEVRSCGNSEAFACGDAAKNFRTVISSDFSPPADLLLKAWRRVNGEWVESSQSPFMREAIGGRSSVTMTVTANLLEGLWRFQTQVPTTAGTQFAGSEYQYLQVTPPDTSAPAVTGTSLSHGDESSLYVGYGLSAADNVGVTQMRVFVNGAARPWVAYSSSGTIVLPDGYGTFGIGFQVADAAGNVSGVTFAGEVTRRAAVSLSLVQVDNNGNVRSCGGSEASACSDVVKKFRTTISSAVSPPADLLMKAWRKVNGQWVESSQSPFLREAINGRTVITMQVTANLLAGTWRFQTQVPTTVSTQFAGSSYQYLLIG